MRRELGTGQLKTGQTAKVSTLKKKKNIQGVINWTQRFLKIICSIAMKNIFYIYRKLLKTKIITLKILKVIL